MKSILKPVWVTVGFMLILVACDNNPNNTPNNTDAAKAQQNRALYNQLLLGEWVEMDYDNNTVFAKLDGQNIEFKNNEILLPKGKWESNTYSRQTMTVPINNFATLFDYTNPVNNKKYTTLEEEEDLTGHKTLDGGLYLNLGNGNYLVCSISLYEYKSTDCLMLNQRNIKNGEHITTDIVYIGEFIKKNNNNGNGNGNGDEDIDIEGSYTFTANSYTHTLAFNTDGTYSFTSGSGQSSQDKSGTWSVSGSTLTMNTTSPASMNEQFTVSSNGSSYTLTLQGDSPVSQILSTFTVVAKTLAMTKT